MSAATTSLPKSKVTRENAYKCPEDFVCFTHKPCSSTLTSSLTSGNTELWLIKAPASFNPQRFNGVSVSLSGLQTVRVAAADDAAASTSGSGGNSSSSGRQRLYSVLGSGRHRPPADLHLLTQVEVASDRVVCGPAFCGMLNVGEVYGDVGGDALRRPLHAIPAAPAPAAPPGLKQRFLPFGSKTPTLTCVAESELEAGTAGPSSATLRPLVVKHFPTEEEEMMEHMTEEEQRRERKRRRKLKRIKTERRDPGLGEQEVQELQEEDLVTAVVPVKVEPVGMPFHHQEEEVVVEEEEESRRKRRKRKKDKERGQALEEKEEAPMVEVVVKCEPVDVAYEELEAGSAKKKKKKRRSKMEDACA